MFKKLEKYKGEIWEYCRLNDISDIDAFVFQCFKQGYDIKKYGFLGNTVVEVKEVEVIKEVRVEIPTEIIKEVIVEKEVIKEIPVDKIIEVVVEKEVIKEVEKPVEVIIEKEVIREIPVDKIIEKEIIKEVEVIKEVPVDKIIEKEIIKEIEVIKEVLVDKIIEVEKEVIKEVTDNKTKEKMGLLQQTLQKLRQENNDKDVEINKLNDIIKELEDGLKRTGAVFLKGSNINDKM
jgi:hypothetical protein